MAKEDKTIYDPENIEYLLLNKQFDDLREKEKAYVLKFISGPAEYAQMRQALLATYRTKPGADEMLKPRKHVKDELLQQFKKHHEKESMPWLNVLILPFRNLQPQVRLALGGLAVAIVLISGLLLFSDGQKDPVIARNNPETPALEKTSQEPKAVAEDVKREDNKENQAIPLSEKSSQTAEAKTAKPAQKPAAAAKRKAEFLAMAEADSQKLESALGARTANDKTAESDNNASSNLAEDAELIELLYTAM